MNAQQQFNEALIKLCILLYQSDGKITLSEQDYLDAFSRKVSWQGNEEFEDFQMRAILQVRDVIENNEQRPFVNSLKDALVFDAKKALAVANGMAHIDGDIADEEQEILDYLRNRVLAKQLN